MTARTQRGFTLIELIASTALFAVLGTMLFQLITGAMDLWTRGERMRDLEERAAAVLDLMTDDLRHLWAGPLGVGEQEAGEDGISFIEGMRLLAGASANLAEAGGTADDGTAKWAFIEADEKLAKILREIRQPELLKSALPKKLLKAGT